MGLKETLIRIGDMQGESRITITGGRELCAENCRSIIACDENLAVLRTDNLDIRITGTSLVLENFGAYGVKIIGQIHSLTFISEEQCV